MSAPPASASTPQATEADLFADYVAILRAELDASLFLNGSHPDDHTTVRRFCDMVRRYIPIRAREVVRAEPFHYSPDRDQADLEARVQHLLAKAAAGEDLNPHLNTQSRDLSRQDLLFNDWGILHFHLRSAFRPDGFVERSGPLLYARVTPSSVHAIGVYEHGEFTNRDLLRVEHANWPEIIQHWRLPDFATPLTDLPDSDRADLRRAGVLTFVQLSSDVTYMHPGGGYASNGEPIGCAMEANDASNALVLAQLDLEQSAPDLVKLAAASGLELGTPIRFTLKLDGMVAFAVEQASDAAFPLMDFSTVRGFESFVSWVTAKQEGEL